MRSVAPLICKAGTGHYRISTTLFAFIMRHLHRDCPCAGVVESIGTLHRNGIDAAFALSNTISQEIQGEITGGLILSGARLIAPYGEDFR